MIANIVIQSTDNSGKKVGDFSNYKKSVMERAWKDFKTKKKHNCYKYYTFADSLHWAHKYISKLKMNGL